jgi:hypothetical protein
VALCVRKPVGLFGAGKVTALLEQRTQVERAIRFAALVRAAVARLRIVKVATLLEQDPKVECRGRTAPCSGLPIRAFGGRQITALLEQHPEVEPRDRVARPVDGFKNPPRSPSKTFFLLIQLCPYIRKSIAPSPEM